MTDVIVRRPGIFDVAEAVSMTLAVGMVAGLPPVSTSFAVPSAVVGATVGVAVVGGLGLVAAFIAASFRSTRVLPAVGIFLLGVVCWVVAVVVVDPMLGWRVGLVSVWLLSALLVATSWFVLRGFPARSYPALLFIAAGAVGASLASSYALVLAALGGGAAVGFLVALLIARASVPPRQRSAAS